MASVRHARHRHFLCGVADVQLPTAACRSPFNNWQPKGFSENGQLDAGSAQGAEAPKQSCWEGTARCQAGLLQKQRYGTPSMLNLHAGMSCVLPQQQQRQLGLMHDLRRCLRGDADRLSHFLLQQQTQYSNNKGSMLQPASACILTHHPRRHVRESAHQGSCTWPQQPERQPGSACTPLPHFRHHDKGVHIKVLQHALQAGGQHGSPCILLHDLRRHVRGRAHKGVPCQVAVVLLGRVRSLQASASWPVSP